MQDSTLGCSSPLESSPAKSGTNVPDYKKVWARAGGKVVLRLLLERLGHRWCIWYEAARSFRGHICTQSAIGRTGLSLGPHSHQGGRNVRTVARGLYTRKLLATRPWADSQDVQMFLMGFDAGESWAFRNTEAESKDQMAARLSWLTSQNVDEINITLDMLKRQWYKSQYESPRHSNPSQSD